MKRFEGKNVVITGAAAGIGQATAQRIAEEGGNVALIDINAEGLAGTKKLA
ncbi:MAG: SDR family NAD(P)-dependent oxidoreductase, partial [Deltaproteobacteria bacterium]|nr:SDR family NAD(P)-dependent oxidoreductase [Deltaproteobacteria bacterium]